MSVSESGVEPSLEDAPDVVHVTMVVDLLDPLEYAPSVTTLQGCLYSTSHLEAL